MTRRREKNFCVQRPREQQAVKTKPFRVWLTPDGKPWALFHRQDRHYLLRFLGLADFRISSHGRSICCWPAPNISATTVEHLYLNQALPLALSRRGKFVLHASAVEFGQEAVAFLGVSGKGKSTLAASFATGGKRFLTDDDLVIETHGKQCIAMPSHPTIRLWEDSRSALLAEDAQMAPAVQFTSKARFLAGEKIAFCSEPRPLRHMYFLGEGQSSEPVIERLGPSAALIELVRHSFLLDTEEREMLAAHFEELAELVKRPMFFRLDYPRRFEELARVRQAIEEHSEAT